MATFHVAHRGLNITSKTASIRLLGFYGEGPRDELSIQMPMSLVCDGTLNISWHTVSADGGQRTNKLEAWNSWRSQQIQDVSKASAERQMRPIFQVRAEKLIADYTDYSSKPVAVATTVPSVARDSEVRGQTWALIGIAGDADYEMRRASILDSLGSDYFRAVEDYVCSKIKDRAPDLDSANEFYESEFMKHEWPENFMRNRTEQAINDLEAIVCEPSIAFFGASENADSLVASADVLAKRPELVHIDLAVVRMYVWINLEYHKRSKTIERVNRNKVADEFFKAMRTASV